MSWRFGLRLYSVIAVSLWLSAGPVTEQAYRNVGRRLMCQCGCYQTVADCNHLGCSTAETLRREVREAIAATDTEEAALERVIQKYGVQLLVEPPRSGFNLTAWVMPFVALLAGALFVGVVLRHWRRGTVVAETTAGPVDPQLVARYAARIDEEIEK
jgi:cytochrome c-type biogenesis protein CcmH